MACSDFSAKQQNKRQPSVDVASNAPPKSPVSSSQNEVVPHINIRSPRPQPGKIVVNDPKRVLQQNLGKTGTGRPTVKPTRMTVRPEGANYQ
jgi:hypothetical protein